jgi:hypothetical protein
MANGFFGFLKTTWQDWPTTDPRPVMVESTFSSIAASTSLNKRQINGNVANEDSQDE